MYEDARFSVTFEADRKQRVADLLKRFIALENEVCVVRGIGLRRINGGRAAAGKDGGDPVDLKRSRRREAPSASVLLRVITAACRAGAAAFAGTL